MFKVSLPLACSLFTALSYSSCYSQATTGNPFVKESQFITDIRQSMNAKMKITGVAADTVIDAEVIFIKESRRMQKDTMLSESQRNANFKAFRAKRNQRIQTYLNYTRKQMKELLLILPDSLPKPANAKFKQ